MWDGDLHGYLGSGRSPASATLDGVAERLGDTPLLVGPHSVTVPGAIAGWFDLLDRWGTRTFGELAVDAIRYARDGFVLSPMGAEACRQYRAAYRGLDEWQTVYGGRQVGDLLVQPGAANLLELLGKEGPDAYYRGPVAESIAATLQQLGGFMEASDLAAHAGEWTDPLTASYRDVEVAELPPPTQGVAVLEILRILDGFDLSALGAADRAHLMIEAVKIGLTDRDDHVTDPAWMNVKPEALLDDEWIARRDAHRSAWSARVRRSPDIRSAVAPRTCARPTATGCS